MALKPRPVIDAVVDYYENTPVCGERSVHRLATQVSMKVDEAREVAAAHFNAPSPAEVVFLRNTTEAINLVARSFGLKRGDEVITGDKEHNSNLVPWHLLRDRVGVSHTVVRSGANGQFDLEALKGAVSPSTKLVSLTHTSNLDGTTVPAREAAEVAHDAGAALLLDGAQSAPHEPVDVQRLGCDFFACSVHKMCGPTGVGLLWGRAELLDRMDPVNPGGSTVADTTYETSVLLKAPRKFEGGLQDYAGIIGAAAAIRYLDAIGMEAISAHVRVLNRRITAGLAGTPGLRVLGPADADARGAVYSFTLDGIDAHDIALILDETQNIAIRSGNHCVHSWLRAHGLKGAARASLYLYNTPAECDLFVEALRGIADQAR
jgi:cysteine desulfurase/selenocysteine lyase